MRPVVPPEKAARDARVHWMGARRGRRLSGNVLTKTRTLCYYRVTFSLQQ